MPIKSQAINAVHPATFYRKVKRSTGALEFQIDIPPVPYFSEQSSIEYENVGKQRSGNCLHLVERRQAIPSYGKYASQGPDLDIDDYGSYPPAWVNLDSVTHYRYPGISESDLKKFINEATLAMKPSLKGSFELPTFIRELPELKSYVTRWWHKRSEIKKALSRLEELDRFGKRSSKEYLGLKFGLEPLRADILTINTLLKEQYRRIQAYRKLLNRPIVLHYARNMREVALPPNYDVSDGPVARKTVQYEWVTPGKLCATARMIAWCSPADSVLVDIAGWLDLFGVSANPKLIWDAIPYSFVVDWFFNIGDILDTYRIDNLDLTVLIQDFCVSQKFEYKWLQIWRQGNGTDVPCWRGSFRLYNRVRCQPDFSAPDLTVRVPGIREVILGGALINANRR